MTKELVIFAVVNLLAATLSGASGGGGGLIATPFMVLLGLPPASAIATAKFGGFGLALGSSTRFFKEKITDKRTVIIFSIIGGAGALAGSLTLSAFSGHTDIIQKLMGIVILIIGIPLLYVRNSGLTTRKPPVWAKTVGMALLLFSVFLQAALGSGIGSLQLVIFIMCFGMNALTASATRRAMQLTVATISLSVFIISGLVDYRFGMVGLVTSTIGGFAGAHIAVKKGNKFIVNMFAIASALLAIQLLLG
jgi:uncharacterized membrane protein YfcA